MNDASIRPGLSGQKALIVGVANDQARRITGGTVYVDGGTNIVA